MPAAIGGDHGRVSAQWLIWANVIIALGEIALSPMGLSLVNRLAPPRSRGLMMGGWFASLAHRRLSRRLHRRLLGADAAQPLLPDGRRHPRGDRDPAEPDDAADQTDDRVEARPDRCHNKAWRSRNIARNATSRRRPSRRAPSPTPKRPELFFCVQKHLASHLHYDFRLEHNGVLLSWAVPKGPSLDPKTKRLAMHVEDHPLDYGEFEGVIPEGYGAGIVMLWDRGTWTPEVDDVDAALKKGDLKFTLNGYKLKGSWVLVRTSGRYPGARSGGGDRSWLLIKHRDDWAGDLDITEFAPQEREERRRLRRHPRRQTRRRSGRRIARPRAATPARCSRRSSSARRS